MGNVLHANLWTQSAKMAHDKHAHLDMHGLSHRLAPWPLPEADTSRVQSKSSSSYLSLAVNVHDSNMGNKGRCL